MRVQAVGMRTVVARVVARLAVRLLVGSLTALASVVLATGAPAGQVLAARSVPSPTLRDQVPLQEFRTADNAGWFYTVTQAEAASALRTFKFTRSIVVASLYTHPHQGAVAIHRLRQKVGAPSYMLSVAPEEMHDPEFADEGVIGYADGAQRPGEVALLRFSNHGQWRTVTEAGSASMRAQGYVLDGQLGWVHD
ncbi:MAG TPA: hypothetical protein VGH99_15355 [Pseudonocardia sp.]|jgi:hypothetical protein